MKSAAETRTYVDRVTCVSSEERDRIYDKHFRAPSSTVRFLCEQYQFDQKRVLDVACHYGYHLIHFGEGSEGVDATERYVQFSGEMGLTTQLVNIEEGFPTFDEPFDALFFSSTLEEVFSPHVTLMRFQRLIKPGGLLSVTVPTVPPRWFEWLYSRGRTLGYASKLHLYFFTPRLVELTIQRAGYDIIQTVTPRVWLNPWLRPMHKLLSPVSLAVTVIARPRPGFQYGKTRESYFLPEWAADLAPFHQDYQAGE